MRRILRFSRKYVHTGAADRLWCIDSTTNVEFYLGRLNRAENIQN